MNDSRWEPKEKNPWGGKKDEGLALNDMVKKRERNPRGEGKGEQAGGKGAKKKKRQTKGAKKCLLRPYLVNGKERP